MVLSADDKRLIAERVKKQVEALKKKTTPTTPPRETEEEAETTD